MTPKNKKFKKRAITIDAIIIKNGKLLLIKRKYLPFRNYYALPGGHINYGETAEKACIREVKEETGLTVKIKKILAVYSKPKRDPRGHTISICYLCSLSYGKAKASDDARDVIWLSIGKLPKKLAFDHKIMINDFLKHNV